ncbi:MAG: hypothetical protein ACI8QZ_000379 [Chlamydiales bacterium]
MKPFDLDWIELLQFAHTWEELPPDLRGPALALRRNESAALVDFEESFAALEAAKIFERNEDGERVQPTDSFRPLLAALRFMKEVPVFQEPTARMLEDYMAQVLTLEERSALAGQDPWSLGAALPITLAGRRYVDDFLESDAAFWERQHLTPGAFMAQATTGEKILVDRQAGEDLRTLLRKLMERPVPISFLELPTTLSVMPPRRLADAIWAGLRYGLAYAGFDDEDRPALGIWPAISERVHRPPTPPPETVTPDISSCLAWAVEDLVQLLVFCSEPRRLRTTDRALFAKAEEQLESLLVPIPEWLGDKQASPLRVHRARWYAESHGLLVITGQGGASLRLQLSDAGRDWLALDATERAQDYLEPQRLDDDDHRDAYEFAPAHSDDSTIHEIAAAFDSCEGAVRFQDFLTYNRELVNPLLDTSRAKRRNVRKPAVNDEVLEREWSNRLSSCMDRTLLPNGGLRTGRCGDDLTIELTDVGRYLLCLTDTLEWPSAAESASILVQPDFEIVFLTSSPPLEASLTRFAERIGQDIGILFRLTRQSIQTASRAGLTHEAMLATLQEVSRTPIPDNVAREIRGWCAQTVHLAWEPMQLIRCPDEETAVRVLSAAKGKLEMLTPTLLILTDASQRTTITASCNKDGVFLDLPDEPARSKPGRSRRRSWGH